MSGLDEARREIDEIDKDMAALFARRMDAATKVAEYKRRQGLPVLDAEREQAVVAKNTARLQNPALEKYYTDFLRHLMALSRQYQQSVLGKGRVAYQGAEGGFGQMVASALFPNGEMLQQPTFGAVFSAVAEDKAAYGVVPFENSTTGDVSGVLDLCYAHNLYITAMYDLPVTQNLLGLPGATLGDIKTVTSHVQALEQSRRFLESLGAKQRPAENTAVAARLVAETGDKALAAIASAEAAELYGLALLAKDIATDENNTTRFIVISKEKPTQGDRFALLVTVENTVGQLAAVIEAIAAAGYNMESIKSRPMPKRPWEYYFYMEMVGAPGKEESRNLLEKVGAVCLSVRMLGIYNRITAHEDGML